MCESAQRESGRSCAWAFVAGPGSLCGLIVQMVCASGAPAAVTPGFGRTHHALAAWETVPWTVPSTFDIRRRRGETGGALLAGGLRGPQGERESE